MEATCTLSLYAYSIYTYPVRTWNLQAKFSYPVNRRARMIQLCTDHFNFHIPAIYILYVLKYNNVKKYRYRNKDTYPVTKVIITKQGRKYGCHSATLHWLKYTSCASPKKLGWNFGWILRKSVFSVVAEIFTIPKLKTLRVTRSC